MNSFSKTVFVCCLLGSLLGTGLANEKPNVVFILADDLGWRDLSNEGSTFYESPNIDRIANEGTKFTQGYATCQVCSPSRASIMTGKYPARLNITDWIGAGMGAGWKRNTKLLPATYEHKLPAEDTTIAEAFREAGYRTFFAGKWHLGSKGSHPEDHGFEFNVGGHERGSPPGGYFSPYSNPKMKSGPKGELLPLRLGNETANFIEEHKDEPFFAFLSFYSVHGPIQSTEALWKKYREKASRLPQPENRFVVDGRLPVRQVQDNPLYGGMVESMDDAVGIVLKKLDELGLEKNTIVCFTSDNGGVSAGDGKATSNLPLRGGKGRQFEGGLREPFYIKVPGQKPNICNAPVIGTDFYPTLLDLCRLESRKDQHVDGRNLTPLLTEPPPTNNNEWLSRSLFWHYPHYGNQGGEPSSIVRQGKWKLIRYHETNAVELYDILADVGEQSDLSKNEPEVSKRMEKSLDAWLAEVDARMPTVNPNFNSVEFEREQNRIRTVRLKNLEKSAAALLDENFRPRPDWWEKTGQ